MIVQIMLQSGLADPSDGFFTGELRAGKDAMYLSWTQPVGTDETTDTKYSLAFTPSNQILSMSRAGDTRTDLIFSGDAGVRTEGRLSTPHGDFGLDIETREIVVPDALWHLADENAVRNESATVEEAIQLHYFLHLSGAEPVENHILVRIRLEKKADTM